MTVWWPLKAVQPRYNSHVGVNLSIQTLSHPQTQKREAKWAEEGPRLQWRDRYMGRPGERCRLGGSAPEYCALFHLAFGTCVLILITELRSCGLCCNNFHLEQLLDCILLSREHLTGFWVASEKAFVHFCGYWTCSLLQDCAAASGIISCYPRILWECYSSFSVQIPSFEGWALPCQVKGPHHQQTLHFIILLASGQCFSPY